MKKRILLLTVCFLILSPSCMRTESSSAPDTPTPVSSSGSESAATPQSQFWTSRSYSQNIRFEHLGLDEGLSQSVVNCILQDQQGFLWIGTEDGLNRFDGYHFKVFRPDADNPFSLSDRWITSLVEDPQGTLWVGTRLGGLNRYDPRTGEFTRFLHDPVDPESLSHDHVTALFPDEQGLWIGTENGLDHIDYRNGSVTHLRSFADDPNSLSSNMITSLYKDNHDVLWIGTLDGGLNRYNQSGNSFQTYKYNNEDPDSLSSNRVLSIQGDETGNLWVGTANGLNRFELDGNFFTRFMHSEADSNSLGGNSVFSIYRDRSGGLWVGTNNGLDRYDPWSKRFIHHHHQPTVANSLDNNVVYAIHEDLSGVLWVGTYGGGLNKYNRQQDRFAYYRHNPDDPNSLSDDFVLPIAVDPNGIAWIGTQGTGLNRFNPVTSRFIQYRHDPTNPNSLGNDEVFALLLDHTGILWIGTSSGLDRFDSTANEFTHYYPDPGDPNSLSGAPIFTLYEDQNEELWIGTGRGLDQFDPVSQTFVHYQSDEKDPDSLYGNQVTSIFKGQGQELWVGTFDDGLKRIDPQGTGITRYVNNPDDPHSLGSNSILCLVQDRQGRLWIGTTGGGLNRYEPETNAFTRFTEKEGLPNNVIYGILEDFSGNLWLSTNFGLSRFDPVTQTFRNFTASDGLQSNEFNQNAFARDSQGNLYFGGINGFNVFSPARIEDNPYAPPVVLTSITQDGRPLNRDVTPEALQEITLTWPQDAFEFEFTALAFGQPSKNQYAYKLENFEANWNNIGTQRNGRYTNLPGGTYTLRLRGSNNDGTRREDGLSIRITVVPPFWETWWFRGVLLVVLAGVIAGGYRLRLKSIEGRNRELERLVKNRTADLEKRSLEIEALYQADEKILRNVTLNQVFQTLVDVSVDLLHADRSLVLAWNEEETRLLPRVSRGFSDQSLKAMQFTRGEGPVGKVLDTNQPVIVHELDPKDLRPDLRQAILAEGIRSFAHLPIPVDEKVIAVFNVSFTRPNAISDDILRLYSALIQRASLSIANMQLFEQTKDLAVIAERNRLARDLHDSAKQKAFAALAQLGTANGMLKIKPDSVKPHLGEAETLVYEVIQELTFLIQEIYPIALQEKGLATTLREYVFEWENRNDIVVNLTVQDERPLTLETEQAIYRVIQEALANVSRHSHAQRVEVSLVYNPDSLQVLIMDDGCGFEINQKAKGMGFRSMQERISSTHGTIQIQSAPGQGTRVMVFIPVKG
jgi:ligand-binding sensor domain-containing protein/signal transduction histidine kinase